MADYSDELKRLLAAAGCSFRRYWFDRGIPVDTSQGCIRFKPTKTEAKEHMARSWRPAC
ncbi:MAG: hypothetical protein ABIR73_02080 [Usitatibacter sp.]